MPAAPEGFAPRETPEVFYIIPYLMYYSGFEGRQHGDMLCFACKDIVVSQVAPACDGLGCVYLFTCLSVKD